MEEEKIMKVNPIKGVSPSFKHFKTPEEVKEQTKTTTTTGQKEPSFDEVMKQLEYKTYTPVFKGHWPNYYKPEEPTKPVPPIIKNPDPTEPQKTGTLNFIV